VNEDDWATRVAAVWNDSEQIGDSILRERIDALVAERPVDDPEAAFEAASVRDSTGLEAEAADWYQRALDMGLGEPNLGRTYVQYGSTLRNLGRFDEALALLDLVDPRSELADAAAATRALVLVSMGRPVEGASVAIAALAQHLPRYQRSMRNYAAALLENDE
jgi:tetratricopeptide (TPR) repeat protein